MDPKLPLAQALEDLAEGTELFAQGKLTPRDLRYCEATVHRAQAALYRHEAAGQGQLLRAVRALAGLDKDSLKATSPDAMRRVLVARGWTKTGEIPWPGDPSRTAFDTYDHPTARECGGDPMGVIPAVLVPYGTEARDYPRLVMEWATDLATRHGDVAPAEVLAEAWAKP
jgi:hypothetical protein